LLPFIRPCATSFFENSILETSRTLIRVGRRTSQVALAPAWAAPAAGGVCDRGPRNYRPALGRRWSAAADARLLVAARPRLAVAPRPSLTVAYLGHPRTRAFHWQISLASATRPPPARLGESLALPCRTRSGSATGVASYTTRFAHVRSRNRPLPTAHCPLPTAHCPLPTAPDAQLRESVFPKTLIFQAFLENTFASIFAFTFSQKNECGGALTSPLAQKTSGRLRSAGRLEARVFSQRAGSGDPRTA
jgi:hypothetical protein